MIEKERKKVRFSKCDIAEVHFSISLPTEYSEYVVIINII